MASLAVKIIAWSRRCVRPLPWRGVRGPAPSRAGKTAGAPEPGGASPYRIWVSEIMLQQTRVETVIPYYRRFLNQFPSLRALARASPQSVLKAWEGLGYYSRALNLHRAAVRIQKESGGRLPRTAAEWQRLPGVGRYTAAAIASLAFDEPAAALDANARRILARVFAYRRRIGDVRSQKELSTLYQRARGRAAPGAFFQALMDLGQLICLPRQPRCADCPVSKACIAFKRGWQDRLPVRPGRVAAPHVDVTAAVIFREDEVLIAKRPEGKLLGGMWEFPGGKAERGETLPECLRRELKEELGVSVRVCEKILAVQHAFSHFRITLHVFRCDRVRGRPKPIGAAAVRWARIRDLTRYPMGRTDRIVSRNIASKPEIR
ncbi:MAG: A/G-specific adenine glycosylase [Anaerolineales bacterium]|nr:A/G-specific adenine glycosylase [Anaerolineales bacterium]